MRRRAILLMATMGAAVLLASGVALAQAFVTKWGSLGSGDGQFQFVTGVATDSSGDVYVADSGNHRVQKFDFTGSFITKWGSFGTGDGQFNTLGGVATDSSGNVYVTDAGNHRVHKFDSTGSFITKWGSVGTGDGLFNLPTGIATDSSGNVYVADQNHHRIQKFSSTGSFVTKWGSVGTGDGQFRFPTGVATDSSGNVYVVDQINYRVQKFDSTGGFITKWGSQGTGDGQFDRPHYVATDSSGDVYVTDTHNHRVQKFDSTGGFITKWGSQGTGDGQFQFPYGVATDSSHNVYVTDSNNFRVQKFSQAPPATPSIPDLDAASDSGASNTDNLTNDDAPTFIGTADAGSTVKIYVDGFEQGSGTATPEGNYSITTTTLQPGNRSITAKASNSFGESGESQALSITIDTQAPETTIDSGPSGPTNDTTPTYEFSSEPNSTFQCRLTRGGEQPGSFASCSSGDSFRPLATDGGYAFEVKATDPAGNTGSPASRTFTLDTTPPTVISVTPPANPSGNITVQFSEAMNPDTLMQVLNNDPKQPSTSPTVLLFKGGPTSTLQVPAKVSCADGLCRTVILDPDSRLGKRKTYTVRIEGAGDTDGLAVKDLVGSELAQDFTSSFGTSRS